MYLKILNCFWSFYFLFNVIHGLRWNSSGEECNNDMIISLRLSTSNTKIDLHQKEQIVVLRDTDLFNSPIHIYCFIAGYNEDSDITFSFCKDSHCLVALRDNIISQNFKEYNMNIKVQTKFENSKGIKVEITLPPDSIDASGDYYCKATENKQFSIRSNNVQIRDIIYWQENLVTNNENTITKINSVLTKEHLPFLFNCSSKGLNFNIKKPDWIDQEFVSPVLWSVCPVMKNYENLPVQEKMTFKTCVKYTISKLDPHLTVLEPRDISKMVDWNSYVNQKGELIIFDMTQSPDTSFALMCYRKWRGKAIAINTYVTIYKDDDVVKGIEFDSSIVNRNHQLLAKSPKLQNVTIFTRKIWPSQQVSKGKIVIYAKYSAPNTAIAKWWYNNNHLNERTNLKIDKYKVTFNGDINSDLAGNYTLIVKDKGQTLSMTQIITVLGSPTIKDPKCLPQFDHVLESGNVSLTCYYENDPDELSFQINNQEVKPNDQLTKSDLQKSYPYLSDFYFNVSAIKNTVSNVWTMKYNAFQLRKSSGQTKYQDHSITFIVKNKYGLSVRSTSIYVVPKVESQILEFPHALNCTPSCKSTEIHNFKCRFNENEYKNKELTIDHYWTMNGHRLDKSNGVDNIYYPYFKMDPINKDLQLMEINSSNSDRDAMVKKVLKSTFLVCRVDLMYHSDSKLQFLYYSNLDKNLSGRLTVELIFDKQPSSAFVTWIIIAILGLLLIIILIVIIYNRTRSEGDTYLLEKLEVKHGLDRDKELEKQKFKPYQYKNKHLDTDSIHSDVELRNETDDNAYDDNTGSQI